MERTIKKPIRKIFPLLLGTTLLLAGCTDSVKGKAMEVAKSTVEVANEKVGEMIDNHEYRAFPWQVFLTDEDRELLNQPEIPKLAEIEFSSYPIVESIDHVNGMVEKTNEYVNDFSLYEQHMDDETTLGHPLRDIYGSEDASIFFVEQIEDMYNREYTYPEELDVVMLEQERINDDHEWILHLEWKALQDSNEFLVYPLEIRLTDDYQFIKGSAKNPVSSAVYTKPLTSEAVIDNTSHQIFMDDWNEFNRIFNRESDSEITLDDSHLSALATDDIELSTLESMFTASRGNLDNASFTGWRMNDQKADAVSVYILSIPTDHEGNIEKFEILYSRPYKEILGIEPVKN